MNEKIEKLLEAMAGLVDEDPPWREKLAKLREVAKTNERWDIALEELSSWLADDQEED